MQEESLWEEDFDNLYFCNTFTKLIKASLCETDVIDCIQVIRIMCIKIEKKQHMERLVKEHTSIYIKQI